MADIGNAVVSTMKIRGATVEVIGYWDEYTPDGKFDFYDIFVDGECINLGDPFYERPSKKMVKLLVSEFLDSF